MLKRPEFVLNENLRFVPKDPSILQTHVEDLKKNLEQITEPKDRVSLFGEIGVYLRQLNSFQEAETYLQNALELIAQNNLGIAKEVQQKIRLAHVWQDMNAFNKSNTLFAEIIHVCRSNTEASPYLDFALQHAGKNEFDQGRYQSALAHFREALELRLLKNSAADQIESTRAAIQRTQELIEQADSKTLVAYSAKAQEYSQDWLSQPEPADMYELLKKYFIAGGETVDIGCGNGRDANWLVQNGFPTIGYDASSELLRIASSLYPNIQFRQALLPSLDVVQKQFDNILCETVIMHLPQAQISEAIESLKRILSRRGILYLSWRVTEKEDLRHVDGRLYSAFDPQFIVDRFSKNSILHFEDKISASSGKRVCRLIYRKE